MVEEKKAELLLLDSAPLNTDELAEIFLLLVRALPVHLTPLDRFEHELPESFALPPHRTLLFRFLKLFKGEILLFRDCLQDRLERL